MRKKCSLNILTSWNMSIQCPYCTAYWSCICKTNRFGSTFNPCFWWLEKIVWKYYFARYCWCCLWRWKLWRKESSTWRGKISWELYERWKKRMRRLVKLEHYCGRKKDNEGWLIDFPLVKMESVSKFLPDRNFQEFDLRMKRGKRISQFAISRKRIL